MGTDLILKKDGEYVCSFGRSYHFMTNNVLEFDYATLNIESLKIWDDLRTLLLPLVAYSPKNKEELDKIINELEEDLEYYEEAIQKMGQKLLISHLLEDDGVVIEED